MTNGDSISSAKPTKKVFPLIGILTHPNMLGIIDQGIVGMTGFATVVLLGRTVMPEELGVYSLALSVFMIAKMVQEATLTGPYTVFSHRFKNQRLYSYSGNSLIQGLLLSTAITLGLALFSLFLYSIDDPNQLLPTFSVLVFVLGVMVLREFIRRLTIANLEVKQAVLLDIVVAITQIVGLLLLIQAAKISSASTFLVTGIACFAGMAVWLRFSKTHFILSRKHLAADFRQNWNFGKWALAGQSVGTIMLYAMPWLLTLHHGKAAAGLFAASNSLVGIVNTILLGLGNVMTPKVAKGYQEGGRNELWRVLWHFSWLYLTALGGFVIGLALWGDLLFDILFGEHYPNAGPIISILAFNIFATAFVMVAGTGLWAINRPSANFVAEIVRFAVTLVFVLLLVPKLSVLGSAYALLAGSIGGAVVSFVILWRFTRVHSMY